MVLEIYGNVCSDAAGGPVRPTTAVGLGQVGSVLHDHGVLGEWKETPQDSGSSPQRLRCLHL